MATTWKPRLSSRTSEPGAGGGARRPANPVAVLALVGLLVLLAPLVLDPARVIEGSTAAQYCLLTMALCAVFSYLGYPSLAQGLFASLAGYTMAVLASRDLVPTWVGLLIGVAAAAVVALGVGAMLFQLRGFYFAMATLLLSSLAGLVVGNVIPSLTGGFTGIAIPTLEIGSLHFDDYLTRYYVCWVVVLLVAAFLLNLERSKVIRAARAVKGSERLARLLGIAPLRLKLTLFTISGALGGLGGALLGASTQYLTPDTYDLGLLILVLVGVVVGGRRSVWGALAGAVFITVLSDALNGLEDKTTLVYGIVLTVIVTWLPGGIAEIPSLIRRLLGRSGRAAVAPTTPGLIPDAIAQQPATDDGGRPLLELHEVGMRYGDFVALEDLSLTVNAGSVLAVMGPNGAGKSTAMQAIAGAVRPTTGRVVLDGTDITASTPEAIRRLGLARSLQTPMVYGSLAIWENIALGLDFEYPVGVLRSGLRTPRSRRAEREIRERSEALAQMVGLGSVSGRPASTLSFGQRRLVDLARIAAGRPRVLLLDEPMAGLSPAMVERVAELIALYSSWGCGILLIEHNFEHVIASADEAVFLSAGRVLSRGPIQSLMSDERVVEHYVGL
jgi:branched-chain amino acid transport system permease protein